MEFSSRRLADVIVAAPVGQFDHLSAQQLQAALAPILDEAVAGKTPVVLDFSGVDYISSMASGACLAMRPEMTASVPLFSVESNRPWFVVGSNA